MILFFFLRKSVLIKDRKAIKQNVTGGANTGCVCFCVFSQMSIMVQHKLVLKSMDSGGGLPHLQSLFHHLATNSVTLRKLPHPSLAQFHHL